MADPDGLQGLGRRSALGFAGAFVSGIATIAGLVIASQSLSSVEVGRFFVATAVFALAQGICSLGIDTGLQYWIPAIAASATRHLLRVTLGGVAAVGLLAGVVVFAAASPLAGLLDDSGDAGVPSLIRAIAVLVPCAGLYEVAFGALRSIDRMLAAVALDRIIRPIAQVVAMIGVALADGGSLAMSLAWTIPLVVSTLLALGMLLTSTVTEVGQNPRATLPMAEFWHFTTPRAVARFAQVLTQRLDVILIAALSSIEDAGVYGTVSRCMIAGVFVATAVQQVVQPRLRRLVVTGELAAVKTMYAASTTWLVLATWPAYLGMAILSPFALRLFGPDYERGSTALTILSLTMLVASGCGLVDVVLLMVGKSWLSTGIVCAALALNVVLNLSLIGRFGMNGAAVAWSAAIVTTNLVPLAVVARLGLHPFGIALRRAVTVAVLCFAVPLLAGRLSSTLSSLDAAIALSIALVAYVLAVALSRRVVLLDRFFADLSRRSPRLAAPRSPEVTVLP